MERDEQGQGMKAAEGLQILGAPYGEHDWCQKWLKEYGDDVQKTLDAIVELSAHDNTNAAQAAFLLLRFSASTKVPRYRAITSTTHHIRLYCCFENQYYRGKT